MSKVNPRSYQSGLAVNDADLRESKHDEIMHWLSNFVNQEANIRSLIRPVFAYRSRETVQVFDSESKAKITQQPEHRQRWIEDVFRREHKDREIRVADPWPNEPSCMLELRRSQWELPLRAERGPIMGVCDFYCECKVGHSLCLTTEYSYLLDSAEPTTTEYGTPVWKFTKSAENQRWRQHTTELQLFFEVKTKIPSVGELMRQLQLYRTSPTIRNADNYDREARLIVVAPPNNEAASVCRQHGISFLEYRSE